MSMTASTLATPMAWRVGKLAMGLVLVATGVALMIRAEIGVAPYDVLTTGLAERTGLDIGITAMILPLLFTLVGMALGGRAGPGTVIAVLVVGPILGLVLHVLPERIEALPPRLVMFAVAFVLITAGITAIVVADIGPGPAELLMLAIHQRGHALAPVRTGIEVASVAVGWVLGGQIGAGTVVVALLIGPTLRWMLAAAGYEPARAAVASDCAAPGA
jgi:uncharacterized membrane protein YczE